MCKFIFTLYMGNIPLYIYICYSSSPTAVKRDSLRKLFKWFQYTSETFPFNKGNHRNIRRRILLPPVWQYVMPIPKGVAHYGKADPFVNVPRDYLHINKQIPYFYWIIYLHAYIYFHITLVKVIMCQTTQLIDLIIIIKTLVIFHDN